MVKQTNLSLGSKRSLAGAGCHAEPPLFPPHPCDRHRLRVQPDHSGPGRGHAGQPARRRRGPAAARHEDLPQAPAGQPVVVLLPADAALLCGASVLAPIPPPSGSFHTLNFPSLFLLLSLQVQKNCLLALCSEYILQEVPFDKLARFSAFLILQTRRDHHLPSFSHDSIHSPEAQFHRLTLDPNYTHGPSVLSPPCV